MKTKSFVWQMMHRCIIAIVFVCACWACDEIEPLPTPDPETEVGEVEFVINIDNDSINGETPSEEPTTVTQGDTLNIAVTQKSSYKDPDGTVFTCEPKATIELFATVDTIYAKDIETLTKINENAVLTTDQSGTNPVVYSINQKFMIGDQEVVFDLAHEVYSYINSLSNKIEMPYVKVNQAKLGKGNVSENDSKTRNSSPAITLRALSLTRASITDSTTFEVNATFNLELESVNTKNNNKQTLDFNVSYVGVVENVTELYGSIVYTINDKNGEAKSPFIVNGSDSLSLEIKQKSTYATPDTAVYTFEPLASISLKTKNDTAFVEKLELLSTLIETEEPKSSQSGENPTSNLYQKLFATSSQEFNFETMYEVYTTKDGDEMPYLSIGEPKCTGIEVTPREQNAATRGFVYDTVYYDVKAKFETELKGVNISDELINTLKFEVNYVGAVINATEIIELVKTTYRKDQVFLEGHDNLLPASQCQVFRDRYYSDGHVETDEFYGTPWMWLEIGYGASITPDWFVEDTTIVFYPDFSVTYGEVSPSTLTFDIKNAYTLSQFTTQISSWEYIEKEDIVIRKDTISNYDGTYEKEFENYFFDPTNPEEGWYMKKYVEIHDRLLKYTKDGKNKCFRYYSMGINYYDRFLCIDDTIIGFEEYRPDLKWTDTFEDYNGSETRGPGKIFKLEVTGKYLDQDVYAGIIDTIYTPKEK